MTRNRLCLSVCLAFCLADVTFAASESASGAGDGWRTGLRDLTAVMVFMEPSADPGSPGAVPLPEAVLARLGNAVVDYEGFVVARLPAGDAEALAETAWTLGLRARIAESWEIAGLARFFDLADPAGRRGRWADSSVTGRPVPQLFWVQFAFPVRTEWLAALQACGAEVLADVPYRAALVRVASSQHVSRCTPIEAVLDAVEPVVTTDRANPEIFESGRVAVTLLPGVEPAAIGLGTALDAVEVEPGRTRLEAIDPAAVHLLFEHPLVLALEPVEELEAAPSDERQSLQVARQWDNATGEPTGTGSYLTWLNLRGLGGETNLGRVAFFDTGIDNSSTSLSHPDLIAAIGQPPRLLGRYSVVLTPNPPAPVSHIPDETGHGTLVASTAVGSGASGATQGNFLRGLGVSPNAQFYFVKRWKWDNAPCTASQVFVDNLFDTAHDWLVTRPSPATIANHSSNTVSTTYSSGLVEIFDQPAWDASLAPLSGINPMTLVVSASNQGWDPNGEVATRYPANAKNVISVGGVDSWVSGNSACPQSAFSDPFNGPFVLSDFSSYGEDSDGASPRVPDAFPAVGQPFPRIKPDLVAPAWRVDGARPTPLLCTADSSICDDNGPTFSFARGTSFAAPVVTGAASLLTKRFRDAVPSVEPKPTLIKAAMIATADSLGPVVNGQVVCTGGDCRPSQKYGWGLLNLDRLTATTPARFFVNETVALTGVGSFWPTNQELWQPADPSLPILIALVWNDIPEFPGSHTQNWALKRDLDLWVLEHNATGFWAGNSFQENVLGSDTGWSQPFGFWNGAIPDTKNNVEVVLIPPGAYNYLNAPKLKLRVDDMAHGQSTTDPDYPTQPFSIYAWNLKPCVTKCG